MGMTTRTMDVFQTAFATGVVMELWIWNLRSVMMVTTTILMHASFHVLIISVVTE